ncbi:XVIPCD domain-containing protein [Lysobacter solisilvae (ex Woo and Kim 2020)]|uniref:DUF2974 domain-containing protein n=1 Tax=Agrilutibacter terrestris TaxID=2865112 RepID=A0A7H0FYJ4_9GAMM|nr:XVIPCD domain-containing protein [Lysobacter terrestris]QNP41110.1 DUF2974 domain-containing protein [Lysobacter terrestris]
MDARGMEASNQKRTFSDVAKGKDPQPIDLVLAQINADTYESPGSGVGKWLPVPTAQLASANIRPSDLENRQAGFRARLYTDGEGHYVLAFCGTNEGKDWKHNLRQGIGLRDTQYEQAIDLSRKARLAFGNDLVLTGHSLGGGLATVGALATDTPAVTFNSAGLHDNTIEWLDYNAQSVRRELATNGQIRRYAVDGEILTSLQEERLLTRALLPDAIGHKIELPDPEPIHGLKKLIPGSSLKHGLDLHGMDSVLEAQQLASRGSMANPAHPANGMFNDALAGLHGVQPNALGYTREEQYRNAAGSLVVSARGAGLQKIDHVVVGANGSLFAVEGPLEDARHRIASVDKAQAAAQPLEASSQALAQVPREASASVEPTMDVHRRAALTP